MNENGVFLTRSVKRLPKAMQADKTLLSKCRGTPWNHRQESQPGRRRRQSPVVIMSPNQNAEERAEADRGEAPEQGDQPDLEGRRKLLYNDPLPRK